MSEALPTYLEIKLVRFVCGREGEDKEGREGRALCCKSRRLSSILCLPAAHWVNTASRNADPPNLNPAFHGAQASH